MDKVTAPHLRGLRPDDARLVCYERDLALSIIVDDMVEVRGLDSSRVRITKQQPSPGSRMSSNSVVAWIGLVDDGPEVGVREPRRLPPSLRAPGMARDAESVSGNDSDW
ncbi:hypothetical protein ACI79C_13140 [Geodermatophilus sp. SYSU D00697]